MYEKSKNTYSPEWIFKNILNERDKEIIKKIVMEKKGILITGDTSTGKTSLISWITNYLESKERVLLLDFHSEINTSNHLTKLTKIGYKNDADIVVDSTTLDLHTLIETALLLSFDRLIIDDLLGIDKLINAIYDGRSILYSVTSDTALNALKMIYLNTIYPEHKKLSTQHKKKINNTFDYVITLGSKTIIQKISMVNDELVFTKTN